MQRLEQRVRGRRRRGRRVLRVHRQDDQAIDARARSSSRTTDASRRVADLHAEADGDVGQQFLQFLASGRCV